MKELLALYSLILFHILIIFTFMKTLQDHPMFAKFGDHKPFIVFAILLILLLVAYFYIPSNAWIKSIIVLLISIDLGLILHAIGGLITPTIVDDFIISFIAVIIGSYMIFCYSGSGINSVLVSTIFSFIVALSMLTVFSSEYYQINQILVFIIVTVICSSLISVRTEEVLLKGKLTYFQMIREFYDI